MKKKENPDAFGAGSAVTKSDTARMEKLGMYSCQGCRQRLSKYGVAIRVGLHDRGKMV